MSQISYSDCEFFKSNQVFKILSFQPYAHSEMKNVSPGPWCNTRKHHKTTSADRAKDSARKKQAIILDKTTFNAIDNSYSLDEYTILTGTVF